MLNKRLLNIVGYLLLFLGISMLFSAAWSYYYNENYAFYILIKSFLITVLTPNQPSSLRGLIVGLFKEGI